MSTPVDFLVLAPLKEEREAVLSHLPNPLRLPPDEQDVRVYYQADVPTEFAGGSSGSYRVMVTSPLGMGQIEAATVATDAIRRWRPRFVLLVGIAGGDPDEVSIGDVLVAEQLVNYEMQKITGAGVQVRYQNYRADARLYGAAQHLASWEATVTEARPGKGKPRCHFGVVITGDKVQAAHGALKPYKTDWPKLVGVEMEAGGVAAAAWQAPSKPGVLMIRGVSDLADAKKASARVKKWRSYACDVAAAYAMALLRSGPVPLVRGQVDTPSAAGSGIHIAGTGHVIGVGSISGTGHTVTINAQAPTTPVAASPLPASPALSRPTLHSLRKLLVEVLRLDSELEAFCIDHFPDTARQFGDQMTQEQKRNLLLRREDGQKILAALKATWPAACAEYAHLVQFES